MMRALLTFCSFVSVIFFPWPFTIILTLAVSFAEPLVPLAVGIFADTLYYTPSAGILPLFTLVGAIATAVAVFVRSRLRTGTMG